MKMVQTEIISSVCLFLLYLIIEWDVIFHLKNVRNKEGWEG